MNSFARVRAVLDGQPPDRIPNFDIMMTFAAHYIGQPLARYYQDYRVLTDANFAVRDAFALDILQAISDPYREAADLGLHVEFPEDGLPVSRVPLLADPADLGQIKLVEPSQGRRMSDRLAAIRRFREAAGDEVMIMGWVEGALAEAADLRGVSQLMLDLVDRPDWVTDLLEFCTEQEILFARAQVEAGADIIGLGDAVASQVSPRMYRRHALPYETRIFDAVHEMGALARLHICGDTTKILTDMPQSGADMIDIDWMVDIAAAAEAFGETVVVGNQDPVAVMLQGTPQQVTNAVRYCAAHAGPRFISAAGCEIPDGTPHANLFAQSQALNEPRK